MAAGARAGGLTPEVASAPGGIGVRVALTGSASRLLQAAARADSVFAHGLVEAVVADRPTSAEERRALGEVRSAANGHDVAFLVADDPDIAEELAADGIEIGREREAFAVARAWAGAERSVGCRVGLSRHAAMEAAEAGADYVRFTLAAGEAGSASELIETVEWWAEIFEVPCMAGGSLSPGELAEIAAAGADFIALDAEDPYPVLDLLRAAASERHGAAR